MTAFGLMLSTPIGVVAHGGIRKPDSTVPIDSLRLYKSLRENESPVTLDTTAGTASPCLSHHSGCVLPESGLVVVVGGWDGRHRTSEVHILDLKNAKWRRMCEKPPDKSAKFCAPVGLSNHTVTAVNDRLLCILGRQGGTMTQRRFGELIYLHLDVTKGRYHYEQTGIQPPSRSGHQAALLQGPRSQFGLFVFGGRDSGLVDTVAAFGPGTVTIKQPNDKQLKGKVLEAIGQPLKAMMGLRFHAMLAVTPDCILVHGGRHFKSKDNVSDVLYVFTKINGSKGHWYRVVGAKPVSRFGHSLFTEDARLFAVGGFRSDLDKSTAPVEEITVTT